MLPQDQWVNLKKSGKTPIYEHLTWFLAPKFKFALMISFSRKLAHQIGNFFWSFYTKRSLNSMACSEQPPAANDASKSFLFDEEKEVQEFDSKIIAQEVDRETCDVCIYFVKYFLVVSIIAFTLFIFCWKISKIIELLFLRQIENFLRRHWQPAAVQNKPCYLVIFSISNLVSLHLFSRTDFHFTQQKRYIYWNSICNLLSFT